MTDPLRTRFEQSTADAGRWLSTLETSGNSRETQAMYTLAVRLCDRQLLLHDVAEGSGAKTVAFTQVRALFAMRRPAMLRLMLRAVTACEIAWPDWPEGDVAYLFGGLALSYARDRDLTMASAVVRVAGRLKTRDALLDEACVFLLDQQCGGGAFGLFEAESLRQNLTASLHVSRLRITVDAVSALSSYLERA